MFPAENNWKRRDGGLWSGRVLLGSNLEDVVAQSLRVGAENGEGWSGQT